MIGLDAKLLDGLNALTAHHAERCPAYGRILDGLWGGGRAAGRLEDLPFLPVSLFKRLDLRSIPETEIHAVLTSSGTTGGAVSRIAVDRATADRQARALAATLKDLLGAKRLPMLLVDTARVLRDPALISARGAGLMGLMRHGRDHAFALDEEERLDEAGVRAFLDRHGGGLFIVFGFTFMVWRHLNALAPMDMGNAILVHSGGWKKMEAEKVDRAAFRARLGERFRLARIHDFYGMAEQLGSIFVEAEPGALRPPAHGGFLIRHPETWAPQPEGKQGLIQVLSLVPASYPGHSLLTEDLGVAVPGGLVVLGRMRRAEPRGCSDVMGG